MLPQKPTCLGQIRRVLQFCSGGWWDGVYGLPKRTFVACYSCFRRGSEKRIWLQRGNKTHAQHIAWICSLWDDLASPWAFKTNGEIDGRWVFGNANNTPRVARIDLRVLSHGRSSWVTEQCRQSLFSLCHWEYRVHCGRYAFSVPPDYDNDDVPINTYKQNFKGHISFVSVAKKTANSTSPSRYGVPAWTSI